MIDMDTRLQATNRLPTPSGIAMELLRLCRDESTTLKQIAALIEKDTALSGRILRQANSASAHHGRIVVSITDAVVNLGMRTVQHLALGFSLLSSYREGPCEHFDYVRFWSRSLATGIAAKTFISQHGGFVADEAFACGLLSQVGRLALATLYPDDYSQILTSSVDENDLLLKEKSSFGVNYRELSGEMLEDWGVPSFLLSGVVLHWDLDCAKEHDGRVYQFARYLALASELAQICVDAQPQHEKIRAMGSIVEKYGLKGDFDQLCHTIVEDWQEWSRLFELTELLPISARSEVMRDLQLRERTEKQQQQEQASLLILAVDDDPMPLALIKKVLSHKGHRVLTADNADDALKLVLDHKPQLILTDWNMPGKSGLELCADLHSVPDISNTTYVIMLTSSRDEEQVVEAFGQGVDDYIVKPVSAKMLEVRVACGQRLITQRDEQEKTRAELEKLNQQLKQLAMTDPLTGLPNRRHAMERLQQNWAESSRNHNSLSCILIDIDHFKQVNDNYGHDVGDLVLCEVAFVLKSMVRTHDIACRIGGEEMLIICNNADLSEGIQLAERLRHAVAGQPLRCPNTDTTFTVTISLGVAARTAAMEHPEKMIKAADEALFASKQRGRNRVSIASQNIHVEDSVLVV